MPKAETAPDSSAAAELQPANAADAMIFEKNIGARIRALRLKRSMGLVELGQHTGLSASFLSQLETGRIVPTLRNLARIAMVFSKDLTYFFEPEAKPLLAVHSKAERIRFPQMNTPRPAYDFEVLAYKVTDSPLNAYFAEFREGEQASRPHQHDATEFLFVTSGALELTIGERQTVLTGGDSLSFDGTQPHSYRAAEPATRALVITWSPGAAKKEMALPERKRA